MTFCCIGSSISQTTIAKEGNFAARISSYPLNGNYYPGLLYASDPWTPSGLNINDLESTVKNGGIPFPFSPKFFRASIFFETIGNDSIYLLAVLKKWDVVNDSAVVIAEAKATYSGYQAGFTDEVIYFQYYSQDTPDSIQMLFMAGNNDYSLMTNYGSYVIVDDVSFYGEVSGMVFHDADSNGIKDANENYMSGQIIKMLPGPYYTMTNSSGKYNIPIPDSGNYTISVVPQQYWKASDNFLPYSISALSIDTAITGLDFGVHIENYFSEVRVAVSASPFRCSFDSNVWIDFCNSGTIPADGKLMAVFDTSQIFKQSIPLPDSVSGSNYFWNYSSLLPDACRQIKVAVENPGASAIGDTLKVEAQLLPAQNEYSYSAHSAIVLCSYDPNDKNVSPKTGQENYVLHGKQLEYLIRFQNTGNDTAFQVTIIDTIDTNLDVSAIKILGHSHPMSISIEGKGIVNFRFNNILLPDSNVNEPGSHGYVRYSIKPFDNLAENTVVNNTAYIYFDRNPAIITNTIHSTYVSETNGVKVREVNDVMIYPNPTTGVLHISATHTIEQVMVYDMAGKMVTTASSGIVDLNMQPNGVYFVSVITAHGVATKKVMVAR